MSKSGLWATAILLGLMFIGLVIIGVTLIISVFVGDIPGALLGLLILVSSAFVLSALNGILKQLGTPLIRG